MKPKKAKILEPLDDETLSSWMWRVNSVSSIPIITHMRLTSPECGIKARDLRGVHGESFEDRDLLSENTFIEAFKDTLSLSQTWLQKRFPGFSHPFIPAQFRRAFCSQCFMESFQQVGVPVSKVQWCYLTKPFCEVHGVLLHDSPECFINRDDYAVQAFVSYWDDRNFKRNCDLVNDAWPLWFGLALRSQKRLEHVMRRVPSSGDSFAVQMFVLTLMRAMMMPALHHAYPAIAFNNWGGPDCYIGHKNHINFYQEIYRSTCQARAHALYLSAIVLGWISHEEAFKASCENYYAPLTADSVWSRLDSSPGLVGLTLSELKLHETQYFNLAGLKIPDLMRSRYGA